jgi:hypothetical protein
MPPRPRAPSVRSGGGSGERPASPPLSRRSVLSTITVPLACGDGRDRSPPSMRRGSLGIVEKTPLCWLSFVTGCFRMYLYISHPAPVTPTKHRGHFFCVPIGGFRPPTWTLPPERSYTLLNDIPLSLRRLGRYVFMRIFSNYDKLKFVITRSGVQIPASASLNSMTAFVPLRSPGRARS